MIRVVVSVIFHRVSLSMNEVRATLDTQKLPKNNFVTGSPMILSSTTLSYAYSTAYIIASNTSKVIEVLFFAVFMLGCNAAKAVPSIVSTKEGTTFKLSHTALDVTGFLNVILSKCFGYVLFSCWT